MELLKSLRRYLAVPKSLRRYLAVPKELGLLNSSMLNRGEVLCISAAVDQSRVKIGGNDEKLPFKIK